MLQQASDQAASVDAPAAPGADAPIVAAACQGKTAQPLDATWMLTVGGVARVAKVHVPASYDPTAGTPLLIGLHGLASSGTDQATITHMIAKSDAEGFIAIHPDGTGTPLGWNGGVCCGSANSSGIDDVAFISALIDKAEDQLCIDPHRVFAAGFSNGAFLAHSLGCELADKVVAIGTVSGVIGIPACTPSQPVAVFHVHGTSDLVIPYGGGGINGNISVADSIAKWVANDGCTSSMQTFQHGDRDLSSDHGGRAARAPIVTLWSRSTAVRPSVAGRRLERRAQRQGLDRSLRRPTRCGRSSSPIRADRSDERRCGRRTRSRWCQSSPIVGSHAPRSSSAHFQCAGRGGRAALDLVRGAGALARREIERDAGAAVERDRVERAGTVRSSPTMSIAGPTSVRSRRARSRARSAGCRAWSPTGETVASGDFAIGLG